MRWHYLGAGERKPGGQVEERQEKFEGSEAKKGSSLDENDCLQLQQTLGISKFLAKILVARGHRDVEAAYRFIHPNLKDLEDPFQLESMESAVRVLKTACQLKKKIAVIGDYDVDGVTSMALLHRFFHALKISFTPFFPERETEGYGLTQAVVDRVYKSGPFDLVMALDCGTNSTEVLKDLQTRNIQTIVIDHHQATCEPFPETILINPHVHPEKHSESSKQLCTVGLVFKLLHAWLKMLRAEQDPLVPSIRLRPFLDLVALGTVADMVPLLNDNRIFVHFGLQELKRSNLVGLQSLLQVSGVDESVALNTEDISFRLGPRINVSGRLGSAKVPFQLLTEDNAEACKHWAKQLNQLNAERQHIEKQMVEQAEQMIAERKNPRLTYVLYHEHWHCGVVGIVAGKLTRHYGKPVFVLGKKGDLARGSGRSVEGVNLVHLFQEANDEIEQWGGHPAAVGLTLRPDKIDALETRLDTLIRTYLGSIPEPVLEITTCLSTDEINESLMEDLDKLAPFGQANENPVFVLEKIILTKKPESFGKNNRHLRFSIGTYSVIAWDFGNTSIPCNCPLDFAVKIAWNYWQGEKSLQLYLVDWHIHPKN